jgi:hypothetical protein
MWFRTAETDDPGVHLLTRIVSYATCLETILDLPDNDKTNEVGRRIDALFCSRSCRRRSRRSKHWKHGTMRTESHTYPSWLGLDLYKLRSEIVHGKTVRSADLLKQNVPMTELAAVLLYTLFWRQAFDYGEVDSGVEIWDRGYRGRSWRLGVQPDDLFVAFSEFSSLFRNMGWRNKHW